MIDRVSFIGGMNVPAVLGRANATVPLAELVIDEHALTLRPRGIGRMFMTDFVVGLDQIAVAFRLRGTVMTSGVGIRLRDGLLAYFWTYSKQDAVLSALAECGVRIEPGEHPARGLWSLRGRDSEAILPTLPMFLQTLAPVLALFGTAIMIVLFIVAEYWWMRSVIVLIWAFSMATTLGLWWKSRPKQAR